MTLLEYMQAESLTLTGLAARLGKSPGAVSDWLTGRRAPEIATLADVSARTGGRVTPADLRPDVAALFDPGAEACRNSSHASHGTGETPDVQSA